MGEASGIEWTDATFNPWIGCTKISSACDNCYAADWANRYGDVEWGNHPRRRTSEKNWNTPLRWNRQADAWEAEHGRPRFVFCASLADVFDNQVDPFWRSDLWNLIKSCDRLVWLLLTKRPQNIAKMLPEDWGDGYPNVWLGATVENQEIANRNVPHLLKVPTAKRFLSIEPIVGPIDLQKIPIPADDGYATWTIDWVITGGESGPNARPAHPDWYRLLRDQCAQAGVPFHFKQWGAWVPGEFGQPPLIDFQNGESFDKNCLPNFDNPKASKGWDDGLSFDFTLTPTVFKRVGKKRAGRLLDGRTWDGRPDA